MSYYEDYPGSCGMRYHDKEPDLRRWFDNYKLDRAAAFPWAFQWLTIEEKHFETRRRRHIRYEGSIGDDNGTVVRTVLFETDAPPPPTFYRAASPQPKVTIDWPVSTARTREHLRQAERVYRDQREMLMQLWAGPYPGMDISMIPDRLYRQYFYPPPLYPPAPKIETPPPPPPPPRYRRNNG